MAKYCPEKDGPALYLECQECEGKACIKKHVEPFYCLVVGSRSFDDYSLLKQKLDKLLANQSNIIIVSGGAEGTDNLAERYAKDKGYEIIIMPADWKTNGKKAGYIRNEKMHCFISEKENRGCVAFWDGKSRGTQHSFKLALKYHNPIRLIHV